MISCSGKGLGLVNLKLWGAEKAQMIFRIMLLWHSDPFMLFPLPPALAILPPNPLTFMLLPYWRSWLPRGTRVLFLTWRSLSPKSAWSCPHYQRQGQQEKFDYEELNYLIWKSWSEKIDPIKTVHHRDVLLKSFLQKYFPPRVPGPQGRANRKPGVVYLCHFVFHLKNSCRFSLLWHKIVMLFQWKIVFSVIIS